MQIPVLVEPLESGGFRARAGDPFSASAEGPTAEEAVRQLGEVLRSRLQGGAHVATLDLGPPFVPSLPKLTPEGERAFEFMMEVIEENRRRENEAEG